MSEAFFVLSGTMKLYDGSIGGDWIDGHPHDFLYVPPGGICGLFKAFATKPTNPRQS